GNFGTQAEAAFEADKKAGEIVAGRVAVCAADTKDFAIRKNNFERGDVIGSDAIGEGVRPAGVLRDVAADSAGFPTGRIRSEVEAVSLSGAGEFVIDNAGMTGCALILDVEFENPIHARGDKSNAAGAAKSAAGQS